MTILNDNDIKELAIKLHNKICNLNHTEVCSWLYEIKNEDHDWSGFAHTHWENLVRSILIDISKMKSFEDKMEMIEDYQRIKKENEQLGWKIDYINGRN